MPAVMRINMHEFLTVLTWFSPAFPTGGFAYSHGIEVPIGTGRIHNALSLEGHLQGIAHHGALWNDLVFCAAAWRGEAVADLAQALTASRERLEETMAQGGAMARTLNAVHDHTLPHAPLPVVAGLAARQHGIPMGSLLAAYAHAFLSNLVFVAVRFMPLSQSDGQRVLAVLQDDIVDLVKHAGVSTLDDLGGAALVSDIDTMHHETLDVRIFKT